MKYYLYIGKENSVEVFDSFEAFSVAVEGIDLKEGCYEFFDEDGDEYVPVWIKDPKRGKILVDIGLYKLEKAGSNPTRLKQIKEIK